MATLTRAEITEILGHNTDTGFEIVSNPADLSDPYFVVTEERLVRYSGTVLNRNGVRLGDFDIALITTDDPVNLTDTPQLSCVVRHRRTKNAGAYGVVTSFGGLIPFRFLTALNRLADRS